MLLCSIKLFVYATLKVLAIMHDVSVLWQWALRHPDRCVHWELHRHCFRSIITLPILFLVSNIWKTLLLWCSCMNWSCLSSYVHPWLTWKHGPCRYFYSLPFLLWKTTFPTPVRWVVRNSTHEQRYDRAVTCSLCLLGCLWSKYICVSYR